LALGEIGINTYDGKVYIRKNNGADSIVQVGEMPPNYTLDDLVDVITTGANAPVDGYALYITVPKADGFLVKFPRRD
jgi:hypothetical protein